MAGKLYIVPTPVGNLEDMTFRAVEVLKQVDLILAEDTRTTSVLLKHYGISKPTEAHHKFNEHARVRPVCGKILSGMDIALVSDAGTPGISDPGFMLARECAEEGIDVITLPGATAFVPALVDSGLPLDRFAFEGFLPVKKGRQTRLTELASEGRTMIFYESPYRLARTLSQMCGYFGPPRGDPARHPPGAGLVVHSQPAQGRDSTDRRREGLCGTKRTGRSGRVSAFSQTV